MDFSGRKLNDADIEKLVKEQKIKSHITQLNLSSNNLTPHGCWTIANALRNNTV